MFQKTNLTNGVASIGGRNTFGFGGVGGLLSSISSIIVASFKLSSTLVIRSWEDFIASISRIGLIAGSFFLCLTVIDAFGWSSEGFMAGWADWDTGGAWALPVDLVGCVSAGFSSSPNLSSSSSVAEVPSAFIKLDLRKLLRATAAFKIFKH